MKNKIVLLIAFAVVALTADTVFAQTTSVLTDGLYRPTKIITAAGDSLLVAEAGRNTPNTGRISIVNRETGARQTLIEGLPSGLIAQGGPAAASGASGLALQGNMLYVAIATGNATIPLGGGLEAVNPNPSSPLFDSVLELNLPGGYANLTVPYTLTAANQATLAGGGQVNLSNGTRKGLTVRVVANLPDYVPEPRPGFPNNVRASNLYGLEIFQRNLYVVDASLNLIYRVAINSGEYETFVTFPNKPNPLFPNSGAPTVEPVPDSVHRVGNRLIVPLLTGFPFAAGAAEVQSVSLKTGERETLIPNLNSAIDVLHVAGDMYFVLEYSANQRAGQPGRLKFFAAPDAAPIVIASNLITPTSIARDESTGDVFVTEISTGRIIRVQIEN